MATDYNFLGIPGAPAAVRSVLKGSIYALILDSVPAHASVMVQALRSNLAAGAPCALITRMPPSEFLRVAEMSGGDFRDDIAQHRLHLFSRESDFVANIFRRGIKRFLDEFDYFRVPRGSFFLFDQAWDLFSLGEQELAQAQAIDYRNWMKAAGNTSLFLFPPRDDHIPPSILGGFNGVARITQSKTAIELLIDFWYSEDGAMAAKAFPVVFEPDGLIRLDAAGERRIDASNVAASRQISLAAGLGTPLHGEAARYHVATRERRIQRPARPADAPRGDPRRGGHHGRDDT